MTAKWNGRQRHPLKNEPAFSLLQLACELANLKKDPERRLAPRERQTWARKLLTAFDRLNVEASPSPLHVLVPSQTKRLTWGVVPVLERTKRDPSRIATELDAICGNLRVLLEFCQYRVCRFGVGAPGRKASPGT